MATKVYEDAAARYRQRALPDVAKAMAILPNALTGTVFHVSFSEDGHATT